jgi:hypothetical protein
VFPQGHEEWLFFRAIDNQRIREENVMKTRNTTTKLIAIVMTVGMLAATWFAWGTSRAGAVTVPSDKILGTGVFSLAQGQATSAHVVNTGEEGGIVINWRVLDSHGNVHAQSDRRRVELGQASSFDFGPLDLAEGQRMPIRLELRVEGASKNKPGFIATQEVYNVGGGQTTVFLPYI